MQLSRPLLLAGAFASVALAAVLTVAMLHAERDADPSCVVREFEGSRFVVCAFDAARQDLRLASRDAEGDYLRSFDRLEEVLGREAPRVRFAMNAGMFNGAGAPIGLYVARGEEQHVLRLTEGPGNFHLKPNGVFWLDEAGLVHIDTSDAYAQAAPRAYWATQSGPMLVIDGAMHPRFAEDGESRLVRNGVGVRDEHTALFVISSGFVSFGRFARFFRDELRCDDALFLDGTVSSLWAPALDRRDNDHALGPMVVVLERSPASAPPRPCWARRRARERATERVVALLFSPAQRSPVCGHRRRAHDCECFADALRTIVVFERALEPAPRGGA